MEDGQESKTFDHKRAGVSDKIAIISELEHIRRHALRSATVAGEDDEMFYLVLAQQAKDIRRKYMNDNFGDIDTKLWCLCKSAACLRQLAYEVWDTKAEQLKEIDDLVDGIWGKATGMDLSDCEACRSDKGAVE